MERPLQGSSRPPASHPPGQGAGVRHSSVAQGLAASLQDPVASPLQSALPASRRPALDLASLGCPPTCILDLIVSMGNMLHKRGGAGPKRIYPTGASCALTLYSDAFLGPAWRSAVHKAGRLGWQLREQVPGGPAR